MRKKDALPVLKRLRQRSDRTVERAALTVAIVALSKAIAHAERIAAQRLALRQQNPEELQARQKRWNAAHRANHPGVSVRVDARTSQAFYDEGLSIASTDTRLVYVDKHGRRTNDEEISAEELIARWNAEHPADMK